MPLPNHFVVGEIYRTSLSSALCMDTMAAGLIDAGEDGGGGHGYEPFRSGPWEEAAESGSLMVVVWVV
jgi:hypothetical protein